MKKPLFDEIERQIIREDKSFSASRMNLHIATKKFEKAFMKSLIGRFIQNTINWLDRKLA